MTRGYACICTPRWGQNIKSVVFADSPVNISPPENIRISPEVDRLATGGPEKGLTSCRPLGPKGIAPTLGAIGTECAT